MIVWGQNGIDHSQYCFLQKIAGLRYEILPRATMIGRPWGQLNGASILQRLSRSPRISKIRSRSPTLMALWQAKLAMELRSLTEQEFSSASRSLYNLSTKNIKSSSLSSFPYSNGASVILTTVSPALLPTSSNLHPCSSISACLSLSVSTQQLGKQHLQSAGQVYFWVGLMRYCRKRDFSEAACWSTRKRKPSKWIRMNPFQKLPRMSQMEKALLWKIESLVYSVIAQGLSSLSLPREYSDMYSGNWWLWVLAFISDKNYPQQAEGNAIKKQTQWIWLVKGNQMGQVRKTTSSPRLAINTNGYSSASLLMNQLSAQRPFTYHTICFSSRSMKTVMISPFLMLLVLDFLEFWMMKAVSPWQMLPLAQWMQYIQLLQQYPQSMSDLSLFQVNTPTEIRPSSVSSILTLKQQMLS